MDQNRGLKSGGESDETGKKAQPATNTVTASAGTSILQKEAPPPNFSGRQRAKFSCLLSVAGSRGRGFKLLLPDAASSSSSVLTGPGHRRKHIFLIYYTMGSCIIQLARNDVRTRSLSSSKSCTRAGSRFIQGSRLFRFIGVLDGKMRRCGERKHLGRGRGEKRVTLLILFGVEPNPIYADQSVTAGPQGIYSLPSSPPLYF